jgi:hypothetical protein
MSHCVAGGGGSSGFGGSGGSFGERLLHCHSPYSLLQPESLHFATRKASNTERVQ